MSKSNPKITQFTLRLKIQNHTDLVDIAVEKERSLNYIIEKLCEKFIEEEKS